MRGDWHQPAFELDAPRTRVTDQVRGRRDDCTGGIGARSALPPWWRAWAAGFTRAPIMGARSTLPPDIIATSLQQHRRTLDFERQNVALQEKCIFNKSSRLGFRRRAHHCYEG